MITWLLYSIGIATLLGIAGAATERVLLAAGRSTRWVWAGALGASVLLPFALPWLSDRGAAGTGSAGGAGTVFVGEIGLVPGGPLAAGSAGIDRALVACWLAASAVLALLFAWSVLSLNVRRRGWARRRVAGVPMLVSETTGPALVGFMMPELVVPAWVLDFDMASLGLLLAHEEEHARARDPLLLLVGMLAVVAMPWNLPLWWQSRRLRLATEMDCDARVLRRHPDARKYGLLLLEVGRMASSGRIPAAAFSEPRSFLERRVAVLAGRRSLRRGTAVVLTVAAFAGVGVACAIPAPDAPGPDAILGPRPADEAAQPLATENPVGVADAADTIPSALQDPTFTPYDVRPEVMSRGEASEILERAYPPMLRDAGVGGTTVLWAFIDASGTVRDTRVATPSGHPQLDEAAQAAMLRFRFVPALHRGEPVPVWIQLPITFATRRSGNERMPPPSAPGEPLPATPEPPSLPEPRAPRPSTPEPPPTTPEPRSLPEPRGTPATPELPTPVDPERPVRVPVYTSPPGGRFPPPPAPDSAHPTSVPRFTPYDVRPELRNRTEFAGLLERVFPPVLRDAGVSATAVFWVYIDDRGEVARVRLTESSGYEQVDEAASDVLLRAEFSPARNRGRPVGVWIQLPVTFSSRPSQPTPPVRIW